ncbi:MAG: hypothetical protein DRI32_00955 [Chloroflexi bacterium]|nr:MAG: hypothetical protein DRI32_00955 [Chloroflexota bacterium]
MDLLKEFITYLLLTENLAPLTSKAYSYDAKIYLEFTKQQRTKNMSDIPFNKKLIRDFAAEMRKQKQSENSIERRLHGVLAFWRYCHERGVAEKPLSFRDLGLRIKSSKNPVMGLTHEEYIFFMEKIHEQLTYLP